MLWLIGYPTLRVGKRGMIEKKEIEKKKDCKKEIDK